MTNWLQRTAQWIGGRVATIGGIAKKVAGIGSTVARKIGSFANTGADLVQGGSAVIGGVLGMPHISEIGNTASDVLRKVSQGSETVGRLLGSFSGVG
jgi:hypothetical protein